MSVAGGDKPDGPRASDGAAMLARGLTGDLRCIGCGYNLKGLSIRSECPECGLPVKATILAIVDPMAEELAPLTSPRAVATGLVIWAACGVLATIGGWAMRANEAVWVLDSTSVLPAWWGLAMAALLAVGALALVPSVRPHRSVGILHSALCAAGIVLHLVAAWVLWRLAGVQDVIERAPYLRSIDPSEDRLVLRVALAASLAGGLLLVRPNLRQLAARSVVVREGRVDRQSVLAVVGAVLVGATGDVVMLVVNGQDSVVVDLARAMHVSLVALGAVLFTSGMINLLRDTLRLHPVLSTSGLGISHVMGDEDGA